ncbi:hypothetical protein SNOG_07764 [Parastagonospora nodorum SN15]|nr:hypothetical protein SNOG_07764 [Parastagonospora nodorum SN15]EAT85230.2 hypothetical protein SNOG_07764 [Parastagonospora nodorum SN15]
MKKAYELSVLTGTQVLLLVVSETGLVYTFTTPKLQPLVTKPEGKNLIQACLNAPEPSSGDANGVDADNSVESPEDNHAQIPTGQQRGMPPNNQPIPQAYMTPEAALHYQSYLQQQQPNQYPMAQQGMPRHPGGHYPEQKLG